MPVDGNKRAPTIPRNGKQRTAMRAREPNPALLIKGANCFSRFIRVGNAFGRGGREALERRAARKGARSDVRQAVPRGNGHKTSAALERALVDSANRIANRYVRNERLVLECMTVDGSHRVSDLACIHVTSRHAIRNLDGCVRSVIRENLAKLKASNLDGPKLKVRKNQIALRLADKLS